MPTNRTQKTVRRISTQLTKKSKQNSRTRNKRNAPKKADLSTITERNKDKDLPKGFAYKVEDPYFPALYVQQSANAWWLERAKVLLLIGAYKGGAVDVEACAYAGISNDQLKYFKEKHPEFSEIKKLCLSIPDLRARTNVVNALDTDLDTAKWWLQHKLSKEFNSKSTIEHDGQLGTFTIEPEQQKAVKALLGALLISNEQDSTE